MLAFIIQSVERVGNFQQAIGVMVKVELPYRINVLISVIIRLSIKSVGIIIRECRLRVAL